MVSMTPKVVVFLEELVEDVEFIYPYLRFKEEGFETFSVAPERRTYKGDLLPTSKMWGFPLHRGLSPLHGRYFPAVHG